jgi:hypothetical protein
MADWLDANLHALATALGTSSGSAHDVRAASGEAEWILSRADEGPALHLRTAAGALVAAHSRRAPETEAARLIDAALAGRPQPALAIVIGAGLGYVVDALLGRDPSMRVLVVEPAASGAVAFLGHRDWRPAIADGRLVVLAGPDYRGADRAWQFVPSSDREPLVIAHPVLAREYPDAVRNAGTVATRVLGDARANAGAEAALAAPYLLNTIENLGVITREGDVDALGGAFAGVPAIVVAAGPSLDRVAADVARHASRALVIAVDTALRPLLARGIQPHLGVAVDPSDRNARHLAALPRADQTWLAAEPAVRPRAFSSFAGRTFTFRVGMNHPWPWLATHGLTRGVLAAWGSVLVSAVDLALRAGASPIAIVGADLAYTGGQPYCRGTAFEEDWAREVHQGWRLEEIWARVVGRAGAQQQPDVHGRPVPTLPHLVAFRDHLLERIAASGVRIVNATGAGILHGRGLEIAALGDVLAGAPSPGDVRTRLRECHRQSADEGRSGVAALQAALQRRETTGVLAALVRGLDVDRVAASVARARAAMTAAAAGAEAGPPIATAPVPSTSPPVWLPEQTAALASLIDPAAGQRAAGDVGGASLPEVVDAARALLSSSPLVVGPLDVETVSVDMLTLPLPLLLPLADEARPAADRFGAALARVIRERARRGALDEPAGVPPPWPFEGSAAAAIRPLAADDLARLAASTVLAHVAARLGLASDAVGRIAAMVASRSAPALSDAPRHARVTLALDAERGDSLPWAVGLALHPLARALAGMVVTGGPSPQGPHRAFELAVTLEVATRDGWRSVGVGGRREARRLTPSPCGPCLFAATLDDRQAIVSRVDGSGSYLVDAAGDVTDAPSWPAPIVAEAGWPATNGAFAWSARPPRLFVRGTDGTIAHDVSLPFTPSSAEAEGHAIRFTALDGIWSWTVADGPMQVVATVPLMAAHRVDPETLALAPVPFALDRPARVQTTRELTWSSIRGLRDRPAGPLGPCWSVSVRDGWLAEAFPDANLVRVSDAQGAQAWVVCDYPRAVAWAGASLVIASTVGELWLVPALRDLDTSG